MGSVRTLSIFAIIALPLGCDSFDDEFTDCNMSTITGRWRIHYSETSGDCGPLADAIVNYPGGVNAVAADCSATSVSSEDQCGMRGTSECPTTDDLGVQRWTWSLRQTAADEAEGSGTVQVNHTTLGTCRSTYDVTITQL